MQDTLIQLIHPTAIIDPSVELGENVTIGPYCIVGPNVQLGAGTELISHVTIEKNTRIGKHNKIYPFASVGSAPQHMGYQGEDTFLEIGDYNTIREHVTLNRGTRHGDHYTRIGSNNYFMSTSHVAHDCRVGDHIIFANMAAIAGFVTVGNHANLGAYAGVHQNVNIGAYCFLGRATKIYNDILPYMLVAGNPGVPHSLNTVGLQRKGFDENQRRKIKEAFLVIYKRGLKKAEIIAELEKLAADSKEVAVMLEAFNVSLRGVAR